MWRYHTESEAVPNKISTHTSRVGCDKSIFTKAVSLVKFLLTHPVWDVTGYIAIFPSNTKFLLTHPVWDVTQTLPYKTNWQNISTHTSRVGCDSLPSFHISWYKISTHTSRVGCDTISNNKTAINHTFLLTHPVWDVTVTKCEGLFYC